jgi:hypothetical protein
MARFTPPPVRRRSIAGRESGRSQGSPWQIASRQANHDTTIAATIVPTVKAL